ncbi:MAG: rhodanese-like domain-containing protein [Gemmatimonadota bacterium]
MMRPPSLARSGRLMVAALVWFGSAGEAGYRSLPDPDGTDPAPVITVSWLQRHLNDPDVVVLEAGEGMDYDGGHIRGARRVDVMAFHAQGASLPDPAVLATGFASLGVSDSSRIVIYGDNMSASMIYLALEYIGMGTRTSVLDGGKAAWRASGATLSTSSGTYEKGQLRPHPRPGITVDADWLTSHLHDPSLTIIDARSPEEYAGTGHMAGNRPGHIPGAHNIQWEDTFDSTGHLRPVAELRKMFQSAGYVPGHQLVVYCTVGMRASHLYFVGRVLGYNPRIYIGSMNDWTGTASRPVTRSAVP